MPPLVVPYIALETPQKEIVQEASDNNLSLWIDGPPGSGKTTVSLHIANTLVGSAVVNPLVLIYNNSLLGYLRSSFAELGLTDNITIDTKDKFFWNLRKIHNIHVSNNEKYHVKYNELLNKLMATSISLNYSIIILDEIQDFNKKEWAILRKLSERFIVLGDFGQGIYSSDLREADLKTICSYKGLPTIFRFGRSIAELLQPFCTNGMNLVDMVTREDDVQPIIYDISIEDIHTKIVEILEARQTDGGRIAVISIGKDWLDNLHSYLDELGIEHIHAPNPSDFGSHDFSENTPVLITSASAKGLEFETVIAFGFEDGERAVQGFRHYGGLNENIYVCLSRAKNYLYILRTENTIAEIMQLEVLESGDDEDENGWF